MVTPVYNAAVFLEQTVESVLDQTLPGVEYIVVDDGSTDGSGELLRERFGSRINLISQPNQGEAAAVNHGVAAASADLVCVVNADDPVHPGLLEATVRAFEQEPDLVGVYPDWELIDQDGKRLRTVETHDFDLALHVVQHLCLPGPGGVFKKSAMHGEPVRDARLRYTSDYDFWMRLALHGRIKRLPQVLATWRTHLGGASLSGRGLEMADDKIQTIRRFFQRPELPPQLRGQERAALSMAYYSAGLLALYNPDIPGRRYLLRSLLLKPLWPTSYVPERHRLWGHMAYVLTLPASRWLLLAAQRAGLTGKRP